MLVASSVLPIISFLCRFFWNICVSSLVFWRGFVDDLELFCFIQFIFSNPLPELKTGLIPTSTRWCGTQRHLRFRIGKTMTKVQKSWKPTGTPCARRKCLLCHCHGARPELVLTVAGRSWGATPSASSVERSVLPWMRRSMMSKKPLFSLHNMWSGPFAMTVVFYSCSCTPHHATCIHQPWRTVLVKILWAVHDICAMTKECNFFSPTYKRLCNCTDICTELVGLLSCVMQMIKRTLQWDFIHLQWSDHSKPSSRLLHRV